MITIETFFILSAFVVLIGLIVWRRDLKSGRILKPKVLSRSPRMVRDLFADTRSPAVGGGNGPGPDAPKTRGKKDGGAKAA
jgi:hypothetical protein